MPSTLTRRTILIAGVALPMVGCAASTADDAEAAGPPDPDLQLRDLVVRHEQALLAQYAAVVAAHPDLAEELAPYTARHEAHLAAVLTLGPADDGSRAAPGDATLNEPAEVPSRPRDAVAQLREAERSAADERIDDCVAAVDFELAQLLGSIAACESAHDRLLRSLA